MHLLDIPGSMVRQVRTEILEHRKNHMPGLVRISFGIYNTIEEVDILVEALKTIAAKKFSKNYEQDIASGEFYLPKKLLVETADLPG